MEPIQRRCLGTVLRFQNDVTTLATPKEKPSWGSSCFSTGLSFPSQLLFCKRGGEGMLQKCSGALLQRLSLMTGLEAPSPLRWPLLWKRAGFLSGLWNGSSFSVSHMHLLVVIKKSNDGKNSSKNVPQTIFPLLWQMCCCFWEHSP